MYLFVSCFLVFADFTLGLYNSSRHTVGRSMKLLCFGQDDFRALQCRFSEATGAFFKSYLALVIRHIPQGYSLRLTVDGQVFVTDTIFPF
jgi:hypothetical protein